MLCNSYGIGDNSQRGIDCAGRDETGCIDDIKVVEVMGFAVRVEDACRQIVAHAAGAVLVADTLKRDALLEVRV